ncbi:hypothetical protein M885DRAFT_626681, partial [Pelagophyceae sp. CCMP2097]
RGPRRAVPGPDCPHVVRRRRGGPGARRRRAALGPALLRHGYAAEIARGAGLSVTYSSSTRSSWPRSEIARGAGLSCWIRFQTCCFHNIFFLFW